MTYFVQSIGLISAHCFRTHESTLCIIYFCLSCKVTSYIEGDRQLNYYNLIRNIVTKFVSMSLNDRNALNVRGILLGVSNQPVV